VIPHGVLRPAGDAGLPAELVPPGTRPSFATRWPGCSPTRPPASASAAGARRAAAERYDWAGIARRHLALYARLRTA